MAEYQDDSQDSVKPSEIEHKCETLLVDGALEQRYNYIVYHFDFGGTYFWARAYTGSIGTVSVHGPFDGRVTKNKLPGVPNEEMLSYLKRRFREIQAQGPEGYIVIWPV